MILLQVSWRLVFFLKMPTPGDILLPVILSFHWKVMLLALVVAEKNMQVWALKTWLKNKKANVKAKNFLNSSF